MILFCYCVDMDVTESQLDLSSVKSSDNHIRAISQDTKAINQCEN